MFEKDGPTFIELMRQVLASTRDGYDMIAPKFDHTPFRTPEKILDAMDEVIGKVETGLDVCCGTGAELKHLRALCTGRVVGLDFSKGMLDEARRRVGTEADLIQGDAMALPFENEFDVVTSVGAFGHIEEKDEDPFISGIARALRPGGRFVFATSRMPPLTSPSYWMARGFNGVMRVRNAVMKEPFIMYYLTFLWPAVSAKLAKHGLIATAHEGKCPAPFEQAIIVSARKK